MAKQNSVASKMLGVSVIGYARVSTKGQNLDGQLMVLRNAGVEVVFEEKASGVKVRSVLAEILAAIQPGQTLVVSTMERLGRRMVELMTIVNTFLERGIQLVCLKQNMHLGKPGNAMQDKMLAGVFAVMAELERDIVLTRQSAGVERGQQQGKFAGRPKQHNPEAERVVARVVKGELSFTDGARICAGLKKPIERTTFARWVRAAKQPQVIACPASD
jgi:DNA invertase Pin-like site-specific DNA recombinase